jgi:hypothetical protein
MLNPPVISLHDKLRGSNRRALTRINWHFGKAEHLEADGDQPHRAGRRSVNMNAKL